MIFKKRGIQKILNIIDEIYENYNNDKKDIIDSHINENISYNNYSELNYISDINNDETKEIIDLFR